MLGEDVFARLTQDIVLRSAAATCGGLMFRSCCDPASFKQRIDLLSCGFVGDAQTL